MEQKIFKLVFHPKRLIVAVPENTTVLEAALSNDIPLEGPCNGRGTCGKCLVKCSGDLTEPTETEQRILGRKLQDGWRLACQARILGNVEVVLGDRQAFHTIDAGRAGHYEFDPPAVCKAEVTPFGLAVDIGTTSLVAALINLTNGKEAAIASGLNPQTQYGGDVLTRITYAHENPNNVGKLQSAVINGINELIEKTSAEAGIKPQDICHLVIAANTTMLHLLTGIDPIPLARAPYVPVFVDYREVSARELGLITGSQALVSLLPSISAFVGADIVAGMVAVDFHKVQEPSLFIDIGTNGEIVASVNGKLAATSSAAGPALEGMNIEFGCRAEDGAISRVQITGKGEVLLESIGTASRKGICGSGIVDLVAGLVKEGVVLSSGRFADPRVLPEPLARRVIEYQGQPAFIVDQESDIVFTQRDIRQVQLAKAAIAAAIEILFQRLEFDPMEVKKIYIAGAFGYHLKPEALKIIGLLPSNLGGEIEFVGNTAKEGARLCLTSKLALKETLLLQQKVTPVELSYAPEFLDNYVSQMEFPDLQRNI